MPNNFVKDKRIILLVAVIALALFLAGFRGLHFGIEFEGGMRLPVILEKSVDPQTMSEIINTIKTRATKFGLAQVVVKGVGNSEIFVEIPKGDPGLMKEIENILKEQGKFDGVVDGKVAVSGTGIVPGSIRRGLTQTQNEVNWEVSFAITPEAAKNFAAVAYGKAEYPVFMYLDYPENAIVIVDEKDLENETLSISDILPALQKAVQKDNKTIEIFVLGNWSEVFDKVKALDGTRNKVIVSEEMNSSMVDGLNASGFTVMKKSAADMKPKMRVSTIAEGEEKTYPTSWPAVGLLSAPVLSKSLTEGQVNQFYVIQGAAVGKTIDEKKAFADAENRKISSILSGGALPVNVIVGSSTSIPAPLGAEFFKYSLLGGFAAMALVLLSVGIRYRTWKVVCPVIMTLVAEMIMLVSIIGSLGTIDLGAMAGIIGVVGTGVNAQIMITDEVMRKEVEAVSTAKRKLGKAFYIIMTNALLAVIAMVPLLFFSGLVEIMGFAQSVILGVLLAVFITRPAYGAIIERLFGKQ